MGWVIVRYLDVFLFDELFLNLDVKFRIQMCVEIKKLYVKVKIIIVYVMYDQVEVMMFVDCIVIMKDGYIVQVGILFDVFECLVDIFVVGFIGFLFMNLIEGSICGGEVYFSDGCSLFVLFDFMGKVEDGCCVVFGFWVDVFMLKGYVFVESGVVYDVDLIVDLVELLGFEIILILIFVGQEIQVCMYNLCLVNLGEVLICEFYLEKCYFFDVEIICSLRI